MAWRSLSIVLRLGPCGFTPRIGPYSCSFFSSACSGTLIQASRTACQKSNIPIRFSRRIKIKISLGQVNLLGGSFKELVFDKWRPLENDFQGFQLWLWAWRRTENKEQPKLRTRTNLEKIWLMVRVRLLNYRYTMVVAMQERSVRVWLLECLTISQVPPDP